ncbi:MAG: aminodeoxychorismate synthase component I [Steroidobacteraceae bacterium]|jgi:anthranilate synthase component 1|nr:aminodeoxychorismate synthase component I [Steroidobacteraceae bacterium]
MDSAPPPDPSSGAAPAEALLALHRAHPRAYPVLLETAAQLAGQPSHSLLLAAPGDRLVLYGDGRLEGPGRGSSFLGRLDEWWRAAGAPSPGELPFAGGWFLLLGYELAGEIEPVLRLPRDAGAVVAVAWRMHASIWHEHASGRTGFVAEPGHESLPARMRADLAAVRVAPPLPEPLALDVAEDDPAHYLAAVERALGHIAAGDLYQANLSRRWTARLRPDATPADVYARLRRSNPAPFAGLADLGGFAVASSSPERLVRVRGGLIETRPIAGTRARGQAADEQAIRELMAHPKERAEHVMLIDLERNDLGRLCRPGSVHVDEYMTVESYAHVHHIVSNVRGELAEEATPAAVIRALFPGGTITGCPKVRCMQLIAELEGRPRGLYTGAMGYLAGDGSMDLNILIRSIAIEDGRADLRAGAGIVADSNPLRELEETRAKARGVLRALAERG